MADDKAPEHSETTMVDLSGPVHVEIRTTENPDGTRVWVNVDGVCRFRAYRVKNFSFSTDHIDRMMKAQEEQNTPKLPKENVFCCPYHDMYGGSCE